MRRFALAVVLSTLVATPVARANDLLASVEKAKDPIAADTPKDVTATSPVKDDVTAKSPMKDSETVAPFVRLQPPSGSLAGATVLRSLHVGLGLAQAYDVYSTTHALRRGAIEVNPLLQNTVASRAAFIGLKIAMTAGPIYEAEKLWRSHHRVGAIALMAAANGIMMGVAKHNAAVMQNAVTIK